MSSTRTVVQARVVQIITLNPGRHKPYTAVRPMFTLEVIEVPTVEDGEAWAWAMQQHVHAQVNDLEEHHESTWLDWQYEVANGDTRLGIDEWVQHKQEVGE